MEQDMKVDDLLTNRYRELIPERERVKEEIINDMVMMIGLKGELICIPNRKEIPSPIAFLGKKASGKSLGLHRLADESFWNWGICVAIMNDSLEECFEWCLSQNHLKWVARIEKLGQIPIPLPTVYVFPMNRDLSIKENPYYPDPKKKDIKGKFVNYIKISLPFSEFLENLDEYMSLGGSGVYLRNIIDDLKECSNQTEVFEVLNKVRVDAAKTAVLDKIKANFNNIFREKILFISNVNCPEYLSVNDYMGNPLVVLLKAGVVPCFITSNLYMQRYKNQIYAYHINSIFDAIQKGIIDKTYLIFDELTKVCSREDRKQNPAEDALNQIAARGRMNNIGLAYATQNYAKIPSIIRSNTEYLFCFRHSSRAEVNEIKNDFSLMELNEDEILKLKKLECVGITSDFFRIYNPDGTVEETSEPVRGTIIPPLSRHRLPSK